MKIKKWTQILAFLIASSLKSNAQTVSGSLISMPQPDGTRLEVLVEEKAEGFSFKSKDGAALYRDPRTGFLQPTQNGQPILMYHGIHGRPKRIKLTDVPTLGHQKSLVVLVEFADERFSTVGDPLSFYHDMLNKEGFSHENGAHGSARDFYLASSYGKYDPEFVVVGPVQLPESAEYYGANEFTSAGMLLDRNTPVMVRQACELINRKVDFSEYDSDGDGVVDNIYFFYAGYGEGDSGIYETIWPHSGSLKESWDVDLFLDDVRINHYACSNEIKEGTTPPMPTGIGTFVHEFGHVLGFADHYDTSSSSGRLGVWSWDTMAKGSYTDNMNTPPLFNSFERAEAGWLDYDEIDPLSPGLFQLDWLGESNKAFRITVPGSDGKEYFVLENRQLLGWDRFLPGHGLVVWHIDMVEEKWRLNQVNTDPVRQCIDIVEADGMETASSLNGDPFPGKENVVTYDFKSWNGDRIFGFDLVEEDPLTGAVSFLLSGTEYRPPIPSVEAVAIGGTSISIKWKDDGIARYHRLSIIEQASGQTVGGWEDVMIEKGQGYELIVSGLSPDTGYAVIMYSGIGSYVSDASEIEVKTGDLDFEEIVPSNIIVDFIDGESILVSWDAVMEAEDYVLTLDLQLGTEYSTAIMDGNGFADGWNCSSLNCSEGFFGKEAPSVQMERDGDYISFFKEEIEITKVSFWHKAQNKNGRIIVESKNSKEVPWHVCSEFATAMTGKKLSTEVDGSEMIRIRFSRSEGMLFIDDVKVEYQKNTFESVNEYTDIRSGGDTSYRFDNLDPETTYRLSIFAVNSDRKSQVANLFFIPSSSNHVSCVDKCDRGFRIYDLLGRKLAKIPESGIYIMVDDEGRATSHIVNRNM